MEGGFTGVAQVCVLGVRLLHVFNHVSLKINTSGQHADHNNKLLLITHTMTHTSDLLPLLHLQHFHNPCVKSLHTVLHYYTFYLKM